MCAGALCYEETRSVAVRALFNQGIYVFHGQAQASQMTADHSRPIQLTRSTVSTLVKAIHANAAFVEMIKEALVAVDVFSQTMYKV